MRRLLIVVAVTGVGVLAWAIWPREETRDARAQREVPSARAQTEPEPQPETRPEPEPEVVQRGVEVPADAKEGERFPTAFLVLSEEDGKPLEGARVLIEPDVLSAETGPDGRATVLREPESERYVVSRPGWVPVAGFPSAEVTVRLARGLAVTGRVLRVEAKTPVAGARVRAYDIDGEEWLGGTEVTDDEGRFALVLRANRRYRVTANTAGFAPVSTSLTIDEPREGLVLWIGGGGTLEGTVLRADGTPAAGLEVFVLHPRAPPPPRRFGGYWFVADEAEMIAFVVPRAKIDERGEYRIHGVPLGRDRAAVVRVSEFFYATSEPFRFAEQGETIRRDMRLPEPAQLTVFVKDADGKVVPEVQVDLFNDAVNYTRSRQEQEEQDGSSHFEVVGPGPYRLRAWLDRTRPVERDVVLKPGEKRVEVLQAEAGIALEGIVVDMGGRPVPASAWFAGKGYHAHGDTDAQGRFRLAGLAAVNGSLTIDPVDGYAVVKLKDVVPGGDRVRVVVPPGAVLSGRLPQLEPGTRVRMRYVSPGVSSGMTFELAEDRGFHISVEYLHEPFQLKVEVAGRAPLVLEGRGLLRGETRDLGDVEFVAGRTAQARFVDREGAPVAGAKVVVAERWADRSTRTDRRGVFAFENMPRKKLRLRVEAEGLPVHLLVLDDPETRSPPVIELGPGGIVKGTASGESVIFHPVGREGFDADRAYTFARCRPDGTFVYHLQPGDYRAVLWDPKEHETREVKFTVRENETTEIEVR